jgi:hypothetical protein
VNVLAPLAAPSTPEGPDTVDLKTVTSSEYTTAGITGAESYAWFIAPADAGTIGGTATTGTVSWDANFRGTATITVKGIQSECEGAVSESMSTVVRSTVGIGENEGIGLSVYPNPTTGKLNITLTLSGTKMVNLSVYNVLGNIVYQEKDVTAYNKMTRVIDLSGLPKGIYHLKVEGDGKSVVRKVVVDR